MSPLSFTPQGVKLLASAAVEGTLFAIALDESRQMLYGAGMDGDLYVVDVKAEKPAAVRKGELHDNYVASCLLCGGVLISGGFDGKLVWTEPGSGKRIRSVAAHDGWVRKLALTPDGTRVVSVGDDMRVRVHDAGTGALVATLSGHAGRTPEGYLSALYAVAVSPDGRHVASGDRAGFVRVWELGSGKMVAELRAAELYTFDDQKRARAMGGVRGLAFSPNGSRVAISGIGRVTNVDGFVGPCRVELWDWQGGKRVAVGEDKHQAILNQVAFGPCAAWLLAAGGGDGGGALLFWEGTGSPPAIVKVKGHLHAFVANRAGTRLYAAGHGGFQVWQLREA
jgi:hypothetical protein